MALRAIDEYLAALDAPKRKTLDALRQTIHAIIPRAEECISYGMRELSVDLAGYESTPGSLHFPIDKQLPMSLVKKLIATRLEEVRKKSA